MVLLESGGVLHKKQEPLMATAGKLVNKRKKEAESRLDDDSRNLRISLTPALNMILFQDGKNVKQGKFIALPATPTIQNIVHSFTAQRGDALDVDKKAILVDICPLFNFMAGKHLFYPKERAQYRQILLRDGGTHNLCNTYGAIHLLRMFATIPNMDPVGVELLKSVCNELVEFIDKNARIFLGVYETPSDVARHLSS